METASSLYQGVLVDKVLSMPAIGFQLDLSSEPGVPDGFHQVEVRPHAEGLEIMLGDRSVVIRPDIEHRPPARFGALDWVFRDGPTSSPFQYGASWPEVWLCALDMIGDRGLPCFESLPWYVHPWDASVWLGMMSAQPRPTGAPAPDPETIARTVESLDPDDIALGLPSLAPEALGRGFRAAQVENVRVALAAAALQTQAETVTIPSHLATQAVRASKIPEQAQQYLHGLPDASLLVWFNRAALTLDYTEPTVVLAAGYLYYLLGSFVGVALAAGLADGLVVPSELVLDIAEHASLPERVRASLRAQPGPATVSAWVERVRKALEQVQ
jgi:hypothetical protein